MDKQSSELLEKVRQQFETAPYPRNPLDQSPREETGLLYIHNLVTPYYLRNRTIIDTRDRVILDAGCGTGYAALVLAEANPGAKIVGIDLSAKSIELARQRLHYHGFENTEFHVLDVESLPSLGLTFDYINCDEVLYLLPDAIAGLQAMRSVLNPDGIIRANLNSAIQRSNYYRAQQVFKTLHLMEGNPQDVEIAAVRTLMRSLKDYTLLKATTWRAELEHSDGDVLVNFLLQGDRGYTIPELFSALAASQLEFIQMVEWRRWQLTDLFVNPTQLSAALGTELSNMSMEQQLQLFELLHPIHRLLDFWCGHPNQSRPTLPVQQWQSDDWLNARIYLHPQLKTTAMQDALIRCATELHPFALNQLLPIAQTPVWIESPVALCLLPLLQGAQTVSALIQHWQTLRPCNPITLEPVDTATVFQELQPHLLQLEAAGCVLLEHVN